jgi:hypothetical protein
MEPSRRFELLTPSLPWKCSTTELRRHGAGCRIRTYEGISQEIYSLSCLTASLTLRNLIYGAACRIRTDDPQFTKLML